jgi:acetoin utilization deacetylase AcuC-like enzyme
VAPVLLATHPRLLDHDTGPGHPERPARLGAVLDGIAAAGLDDALVPVDPRPATRDELEAVHPSAHLDRLEALCGRGGGMIDADTRVSAESWEVALLAAGAGIDAVERLTAGEAEAAFCAVRPPGHHATVDRSMGFCLVNNVAVTAAHLADQGERVLVVDIDAHHGNGTQDIFWDDPRVLFVSFHQHPLYPGTGAAEEVGGFEAAGSTVNFPLPAGATGDVYRTGIEDVLAPHVTAWQPTWLLLSAGFDAHRRDPITDLGLSAGDYVDIVGDLLQFAPAGRRIVFLEGGYDLTALSECAAATVGALVGESVQAEAPTAHGPGIEVLGQVAAAQHAAAGTDDELR